ncbi:MAG: bifunctional glutamate N-acetyltransferase/amino-acid acetyltransferase ArgJ [Pseudomonadota bacterium]
MPVIDGVTLRVLHAGYHYKGRMDLTVATFVPGTSVAGVLTQSACAAPEIEWCRERLPSDSARALVVSAGNSNAFTGKRGRAAAKLIGDTIADVAGCSSGEVYLAATGVIGVPLPAERAVNGLRALDDTDPAHWEAAAEAIQTTDTFAKGASATARVGTDTVTVAGIAKGSGMIAPDMATLLAFVFTDADVAPALLQTMVEAACAASFNAITVDGDTSTSDTFLVFATGRTGGRIERAGDPGADALQAALTDVCRELAHQIVRDGEGATKFIEIDVSGAVSDESAKRVAMSVANSPLVKTAIAGEDANWGRVVMAVGKAGEPAERDLIAVRFGDTVVARDGEVVADYDETPVAAHLKGADIDIGVDLGLGNGRARVWTCDLTHGYITINADYRS